MSALGHKRTYAVQKGMSALPPKADMCGATRDVRFGPIAGTFCRNIRRTDGESVRADISNLLKAITTGQTSNLFIITTPLICKMWSMLTDQKGVSAFPNLTPQGGSINGIAVLVSDGVTAGQVVLADASGIAAASGDVTLNEYTEGSVHLDRRAT